MPAGERQAARRRATGAAAQGSSRRARAAAGTAATQPSATRVSYSASAPEVASMRGEVVGGAAGQGAWRGGFGEMATPASTVSRATPAMMTPLTASRSPVAVAAPLSAAATPATAHDSTQPPLIARARLSLQQRVSHRGDEASGVHNAAAPAATADADDASIQAVVDTRDLEDFGPYTSCSVSRFVAFILDPNSKEARPPRYARPSSSSSSLRAEGAASRAGLGWHEMSPAARALRRRRRDEHAERVRRRAQQQHASWVESKLAEIERRDQRQRQPPNESTAACA
jgi:hypothetical protein